MRLMQAWNLFCSECPPPNDTPQETPMRIRLFLSLLCPACALLLAGCSLIAVSGEVDDGSLEKTKTKDSEERMRHLRESGALRPEEYEALQGKMGAQRTREMSVAPTVSELEQQVEERRRQREADQAAR